MAYGVAPGQEVKDDWDAVEDGGSSAFRFGPHRHLVSYFFNHPRVKFGRSRPTDREWGAMNSAVKRLRTTYTEDAVRRAMDRFYMTRTAANHPQPGLAFCNSGAEQVEHQDDVLTFMANGCQRDSATDLPWDESYDSALRLSLIIDPLLNTLARTFPDVVSEILSNWGEDSGNVLLIAANQMQYLAGESASPVDLQQMAEKFDLPKDFVRKQQRPRHTQQTVAEAVRVARGR